MKVILTEQQVQKLSQNPGFDPERDAPNLTRFMQMMSSDNSPDLSNFDASSVSNHASASTSTPTRFDIETPNMKKAAMSPIIPKGEEMMHPLGHKESITSKFGFRQQPIEGSTTNHQGIDISTPSGSPVYAPLDGIVAASRDTTPNACGGFIMIDHINIETKFCHLRQMLVKEGDKVKKGQVIAYSGGGKNDPHPGISTGPHLHYEIRNKSGIALNPLTVQNNLAENVRR